MIRRLLDRLADAVVAALVRVDDAYFDFSEDDA